MPEQDLKSELELLLTRQAAARGGQAPSLQDSSSAPAPTPALPPQQRAPSSSSPPGLQYTAPQLPSPADVLHTAQSTWRTASGLLSQLQSLSNRAGAHAAQLAPCQRPAT